MRYGLLMFLLVPFLAFGFDKHYIGASIGESVTTNRTHGALSYHLEVDGLAYYPVSGISKIKNAPAFGNFSVYMGKGIIFDRFYGGIEGSLNWCDKGYTSLVSNSDDVHPKIHWTQESLIKMKNEEKALDLKVGYFVFPDVLVCIKAGVSHNRMLMNMKSKITINSNGFKSYGYPLDDLQTNNSIQLSKSIYPVRIGFDIQYKLTDKIHVRFDCLHIHYGDVHLHGTNTSKLFDNELRMKFTNELNIYNTVMMGGLVYYFQ